MNVNRVYVLIEEAKEDEINEYLYKESNIDCSRYVVDVEDYTEGLRDSFLFFSQNPSLDEDAFFEKYYNKDISYVNITFEGSILNDDLREIEMISQNMSSYFNKSVFLTIDYFNKTYLKIFSPE